MDDLNEELVGGEEASRQGDEAEDDDVDIYQDLPEEGKTMIKESDANFNVIERFNKLLEPKKRKDDDFYEENLSEEDVDLYDDLNTFEKQLAAEEVTIKNIFKLIHN
jgi:seryl-tRNA synthetase